MESYNGIVLSSLDKVMKNFLKDLSKKYNLNKNELYDMWNTGNKDKETIEESSSKEERTKYEVELNKKKKPELVGMCTELELDVGGNKKELIKRIVDDKFNKDNIIRNINRSVDSIIISKNKYGNYEHTTTGFVFNYSTKTVIGKQMDDGSVIQLTRSDIELCNKHKFKYNIPSDLGGGDVDLEDEYSSSYSDESEEEEDDD
tara:strand:- start:1395 stop:2000 length:606 start_codon:yes stop_codon:yes gene_type:complete